MEKIREVFKRFFQLPASSADRRIKGLENSLRSISEAHKQLTSRLTLLLNGFSELVDQGRIAQEKLDELEENVKEIVSGDIFRRIEYCQMRSDEVGKNIQEVTHEDIFNRIVFTQNGIIRMENMYQRNMMRMEDQTGNEEFRFILRMRRLFTVASVISEKMFIRVGWHNDGGYVMLDDFERCPVAYSIGIADDVSWDMDIASKGLDVYMYDHTIDELPEDNERFRFSRIGIGTKGDADNSSLRTLPEMMAENGHMNTYGMILKIDVEGAEWAVLQEIDEEILEHFYPFDK